MKTVQCPLGSAKSVFYQNRQKNNITIKCVCVCVWLVQSQYHCAATEFITYFDYSFVFLLFAIEMKRYNTFSRHRFSEQCKNLYTVNNSKDITVMMGRMLPLFRRIQTNIHSASHSCSAIRDLIYML